MRPFPMIMLPLLLASCAPADEGNEAGEGAIVSVEDSGGSTDEGAGTAPDLERTAWRAEGADGAIYITYLDADGLYRDFRNGDPWRDGNWLRNDAGKLCFTPANEALTGDCWTLKKPNTKGVMRTNNGAGLSIKLQQVTYVAPDAEKGAE